jgi:hypothetical protein
LFQPKTAGTASTHSSNAGNGNSNNPLVGAGGATADQSTRDGNEPMTTSERRLSRPHIDAGKKFLLQKNIKIKFFFFHF